MDIIMRWSNPMLTRKTLAVGSTVLAVLALMSLAPFSANARAAGSQSSTVPRSPAHRFSGTWHWIFDGKSFATMILQSRPSGMTGSLTGTQIELDDDGNLKSAEASDDPPSEITKAWLDGSELHIVVMDGDDPMEWLVTLQDETHAEVRPLSGEMANMKPIPTVKAR